MIEDKYFEDYTVGDAVTSEEFSISEQELAAHLELVRVSHPIHSDKEFCRNQLGKPDLLVPGCLTLALARWVLGKSGDTGYPLLSSLRTG